MWQEVIFTVRSAVGVVGNDGAPTPPTTPTTQKVTLAARHADSGPLSRTIVGVEAAQMAERYRLPRTSYTTVQARWSVLSPGYSPCDSMVLTIRWPTS